MTADHRIGLKRNQQRRKEMDGVATEHLWPTARNTNPSTRLRLKNSAGIALILRGIPWQMSKESQADQITPP